MGSEEIREANVRLSGPIFETKHKLRVNERFSLKISPTEVLISPDQCPAGLRLRTRGSGLGERMDCEEIGEEWKETTIAQFLHEATLTAHNSAGAHQDVAGRIVRPCSPSGDDSR